MKALIIDSHKGRLDNKNLHLINAHQIANKLGADLICSYEGVNDNIQSGYDVIIFNHASAYSFVDYAWLEANPNARLFYITNEYNLGEPRILWMAAKRANRKYTVIANHPAAASKVVTKYTDDWIITNLNSLIYSPVECDIIEKTEDLIYYGSFRSDRCPYFKKYFSDNLTVSSHIKNVNKFRANDINASFIPRIDWNNDGLKKYHCSLYIEDVTTHTHYNHLANRFYEALNYKVVPIFAEECRTTIEKSNYPVDRNLIFSDIGRMHRIVDFIKQNPTIVGHYMDIFGSLAHEEKIKTLNYIHKVVYT
jgi:GrpB-like predicted nucleotidyltransferase (UPF0157 family)